MPETLRPPMTHYERGDDDRPTCSNNSPVTFERRGDHWVATEYDYNSWGKHEYTIGVMICEKCRAFVRKVPT